MNKDCVGCGYCCLKGQCIYSIRKYGNKKRCPALLWNAKKKRYFCLLVIDNDSLRVGLAIGEGCSSSLFNEWRSNVIFRG